MNSTVLHPVQRHPVPGDRRELLPGVLRRSRSQTQGSDIRTNSLFVNDSWRLNNNLSFNVGLRWDKNDATDSAGSHDGQRQRLQPAALRELRREGRREAPPLGAATRRYVGQIQERFAGSGATSGAGAPSSYYYYWTGVSTINDLRDRTVRPDHQILRDDVRDARESTGLNQFPNVPADTPSVPGVNLLILRPPRIALRRRVRPRRRRHARVRTSSTASTASTASTRTSTRPEARHCRPGRSTDSVGNEYDLGIVRELEHRRARVHGTPHLPLLADRSNLNVSANWTWSRMHRELRRRDRRLGPVPRALRELSRVLRHAWIAPRGRASRRTSATGCVSSAPTTSGSGPIGITPGPGPVHRHRNAVRGRRFGTVGVVVIPIVTNPGYVTPPARNSYYFTARDAYRTDTITRTDLSLTLSGKIGPVEIFVQPQILNLFNDRASPPSTRRSASAPGPRPTPLASSASTPSPRLPIECPQTASAADCKALGANWKKGVNFGKPTSSASYQRPRTWTISMGVRF